MTTAADEYRRAARRHGEATEQGSYELANQLHELLVQSLLGMRAEPGGEGAALEGALSDEDPYVRVWAATHLLSINPGRAEQALEDLSKTAGLAGFNAKMVLREWESGRLRLP